MVRPCLFGGYVCEVKRQVEGRHHLEGHFTFRVARNSMPLATWKLYEIRSSKRRGDSEFQTNEVKKNTKKMEKMKMNKSRTGGEKKERESTITITRPETKWLDTVSGPLHKDI